MSAYSIFNEGYYSVLGTFSSKDVDNMLINRNRDDDDDDKYQFKQQKQ
jgi:hypothetical protein